MFYGN